MVTKQQPIILWSTQGGRAKACARRTGRIYRDVMLTMKANNDNDIPGEGSSPSKSSTVNQGLYCGCSFDDYGASEFLSLGFGSRNNGGNGDDQENIIMFLFVSTTGDAEHCDSIRETWNLLLQKSLPSTQFKNVKFALFCLGDRAYGPTAFCAAGRKLGARLVQLGANPICNIGYGDDGTPNGGVFCDLDEWIETEFLPSLIGSKAGSISSRRRQLLSLTTSVPILKSPYEVSFPNTSTNITSPTKGDKAEIDDPIQHEWQEPLYRDSYDRFFSSVCPQTAYEYCPDSGHRIPCSSMTVSPASSTSPPLIGRIQTNKRITAEDWVQNTRHLSIHVKTSSVKLDFSQSQLGQKLNNEKGQEENLPFEENHESTPSSSPSTAPLPYMAGDIATIMPINSKKTVQYFLSCLPLSISSKADVPLRITTQMTTSTQYSSSFIPWPKNATLRGILTYCADISSYPEREDLRSLSVYCHPNHPMGVDQRKKLLSLSETQDAALYGDYIIREKRNWADILFDFESIRYEESESLDQEGRYEHFVPLSIEQLLMIIPSIMPRHFSIASAPSTAVINGNQHGYSTVMGANGFNLDLCVAVVEGKTPKQRSYHGLCSYYLSKLKEHQRSLVRLWIRPGSFARVPYSFSSQSNEDVMLRFETPVMCIGAGTGVAPLRSILHEREARRLLQNSSSGDLNEDSKEKEIDNILVFGCRKSSSDFYYQSEWEVWTQEHKLRLLTAFSRDQNNKIYVQRVVRDADDGVLIASHILENNGAVYIAGGAKMARNVRDEIIENLGKYLPGGEKDAKLLLKKLQHKGKFNVEAWS